MITFNWRLNTLCPGEYEIYIGNEIFCHLSENDFNIFYRMVNKSGNSIVRRV